MFVHSQPKKSAKMSNVHVHKGGIGQNSMQMSPDRSNVQDDV